MQKNKAVITGDILKNQASKLWDSLPQFEDRPKPKFSNGWLEGFKHRYKIREFAQHGEAASTETDNLNAISQMDIIRSLAFQYGPYNTVNMDETSLFWKLTPGCTLETKAGSGGKKSKDRVSLALTCNGDGSEKLEPWIIDKSKNR
ncbi:CENP-B-like protein 2, partial [Golovinomyces cichoracearum]